MSAESKTIVTTLLGEAGLPASPEEIDQLGEDALGDRTVGGVRA